MKASIINSPKDTGFTRSLRIESHQGNLLRAMAAHNRAIRYFRISTDFQHVTLFHVSKGNKIPTLLLSSQTSFFCALL